MSPFQNLYLRLYLPLVLALVAAIALAWWVASATLGRTLEQRLESQLSHAGDLLAAGEFPFTPGILERLGRLLKAELMLIDRAGHPDTTTLSADSPLRAAVANTWLQTRDKGLAGRVPGERGPAMLIVRALPPTRDPRYQAVALAASLGDVRDATRRAAWWLGGAALVGALALSWVGHGIVLSITGPVRSLSSMADRIAAGDRDVRVNIDQANELGALAKALNVMAARLGIYENELAEKSRLAALGEISGRVAHEIRNPLTAVKLELQLLGETLSGEASATVADLLTEVRRLELIVATTVQAGRSAAPSLRPTDLNDPVREVARVFESQLAHREIRLELALGDALPRLPLDADRCKQVLVNLLANASDALPDGGTVRISTGRSNDGRLFLAVDDSGPGIPNALRAQLFDGSQSAKPGGLGIGLRLSRELVEQQGGQIEARDSPLGGGRLLVSFPVRAER